MGYLTMEICVDSLSSVTSTIDCAGGSNRYEVCSNLVSGGGLTPSYGLVRAILTRHPDARLMIMIRPRVGSFVYSPDELTTMAADIRGFKELGVMGFVFGCLTKEGEVDEGACKSLLEAAEPLPVTFHRAFDVTADWRKAFGTIVSLRGFKRILTSAEPSGQAGAVSQGLDVLSQLMEFARLLPSEQGVTIMPGSGVNPRNIAFLRTKLPQMTEIHLTGSSLVTPPFIQGLGKGESYGFGTGQEWRIDPGKIRMVWEETQRAPPDCSTES